MQALRLPAHALALSLSLIICAAPPAEARTRRSHAAIREFRQHHPCPATGQTRGKCPGYVIDHVVPLCAGGLDLPSNMQWQERQASYRKDVIERATCRRKRP